MVHNNELSDNQAEWILVTPQVASELLATQVKNRPISHQTVKRYADDMKNGNWKQCGDTICVDKDGHLTDGQHRLSAVMRFRPIRQYQNVYATSGRLKNFELDMIRKCCVAIRRVETNESVNGKNLSGKSEYDLEFNNKNIKDIINGKETKQ